MKKVKDIPGDARNALKERVAHFRGMPYEQLAIEMKAHDGGHLELTEFESATGQEYQLVIDCCYDDMPGGAIRVDGTVIEIPIRPLLGFLPVHLSKTCDGFIVTREGTFLDEGSDVSETDQAQPPPQG
jgi:hypothetical protein